MLPKLWYVPYLLFKYETGTILLNAQDVSLLLLVWPFTS